METSIKRKINIFGKVGKIITTVLIVLLLVAEGFLLTGGVIVALVPKEAVTADVTGTADVRVDANVFGVDANNQLAVKAGGGKIVLGDLGEKAKADIDVKDGVIQMQLGVKNMHFNLWDALKLIIFSMFSLAAVIVALYFFKALMKEFSLCDTPFSDGVIRKMRNFAIALIPTMLLSSLFKSVAGGMLADRFTFDFDLLPVAFVVVVFVLTAIFRYGAQLQREHDDTV